jgi:branched-chain amino acid transport system permease protein
MTMLRHLSVAVAGGALLLLLSYRLGLYRDLQLAQVAAEVGAVAGLTVLIGISGQISIGHGAFMAIGSYAAALLLLHQHWNIGYVIVASGLVAAVGGGIMGIAAARLRGPYLAGATLMLAVALPSLADKYQSVLGGDQGLSVSVTPPGGVASTIPLQRWFVWLCCGVTLVLLVLLANLIRSRVGRSWRALRDDEVAASLAGLNVARLQILAFVVSAACAGVSGTLYAIVTTIVTPDAFTLTLSIGLVTAAVLGGLGSLLGAVWGSAILVLAQPFLQDFFNSHGFSNAVSQNVPIAAYGVVLIAVMLMFPAGIQGGLRRLLGPAAPAAAAPFSALRRHAPAREKKEEGTA